jgi:hypothetical protein
VIKRIGMILLLTTTLFVAGRAQLRVVPGPQPLVLAPVALPSVYLPDFSAAFAESGAAITMRRPTTTPTLPVAFRVEDLAFFCRVEVHLEKATRVPIRFRLGSVDYVDYLEGKRDYTHYAQ